MVMLVGLSTQTSTVTNKCGWLNTHRIKVAKTSAYVYVQKTYMSPLSYLTKSKGTREKNIYNVRGGRNGYNESTKTTQTSVRMAQHNE